MGSMEPALKDVFVDVHRWQRDTGHQLSTGELVALKDATAHVRKYAFNGLEAGAGAGLLGFYLAGWPKFGKQFKSKRASTFVTMCAYSTGVAISGMVGCAFGLNWSGPGSLRLIVRIPESALADQARVAVLRHSAKLRNPSQYTNAFPAGWDASHVSSQAAPQR
eukprot:CAMPEP_0180163058 /NCGR_PEP_ID=MMETSP0986-20121125/29588_1 /TAXON_ID=697907 /ORGANISM="non described non described, Strain CCMP2293" /LENGTH=163 /DNA_ID=CAMNT_0022113651 /DNA_START=56 /DNA_END=543 /DNA_ORIENTATION=+